MKKSIPVVLFAAVMAGCAGSSGTNSTPSTSQNSLTNQSAWSLTPANAVSRSPLPIERQIVGRGSQTMETIASATFTYTFPQTIHGVPAFCYGPLPQEELNEIRGEGNPANNFYVGEFDTANQFNTNNLIGVGTVAENSSNVCFSGNNTTYNVRAGVSYTLFLYHFESGSNG